RSRRRASRASRTCTATHPVCSPRSTRRWRSTARTSRASCSRHAGRSATSSPTSARASSPPSSRRSPLWSRPSPCASSTARHGRLRGVPRGARGEGHRAPCPSPLRGPGGAVPRWSMTGYTHDGPQILGADASWDLVEGTHVARLAVSVGGEPDIYPVTVRAHARTLAFRTVPGTKLATIATNQRVALEWDAVDDDGAWSVVARGTAHRLRTEHELDALGVD